MVKLFYYQSVVVNLFNASIIKYTQEYISNYRLYRNLELI